MDFLYDFKQAQVDRFEDAGAKSYQKRETQRTRKARNDKNPLRRMVATIINIIR